MTVTSSTPLITDQLSLAPPLSARIRMAAERRAVHGQLAWDKGSVGGGAA